MNRIFSLLFTLCTCTGMIAGCASPYYADRGAGLGAITGALAGAAIGEHNGNALAGAALGGAVGTLAGSAIGSSIDADIARNQALIEERLGRQLSGAATVGDVIQMTQAGLSDEVIVTHIQTNGVAQPPQVNDLIAMRNAHVSDRVVTAMQHPPAPRVTPVSGPPVVVQGAPVVIEEYYVAPPPMFHFHHGHHHHRHRPRSGFSWGVSVHGH